MLTKATIRGFKTLRNFSADLAPVSVLVGPNNCGKSNVLKGLKFLADALRTNPSKAFYDNGGYDSVLSRGSDGLLEFDLEGDFEGAHVRYRLRIPRNGQGEEEIQTPALGTKWRAEGNTFVSNGTQVAVHASGPGELLRAIAEHPAAPKAVRRFYGFMSGLTLADFSTSTLRRASQVHTNAVLGPSGENLAAVLDWLDGDRPVVRSQIDEELRRAISGATKVVTRPAPAPGHKLAGFAEGNQVFIGDDVSDGVLLFIAFSTVAQMSGGSTAVCLEEPEKGIHPRRIREVLEQIHRVVQTGSQFILTTHSPVLLNEFRDYPESVLLLSRDDISGTQARQLSQLPDVQDQLRDVNLGDLWYSGVLGGVPSK